MSRLLVTIAAAALAVSVWPYSAGAQEQDRPPLEQPQTMEQYHEARSTCLGIAEHWQGEIRSRYLPALVDICSYGYTAGRAAAGDAGGETEPSCEPVYRLYRQGEQHRVHVATFDSCEQRLPDYVYNEVMCQGVRQALTKQARPGAYFWCEQVASRP